MAAQQKRCPRCGQMNRTSARFCANCGQPLKSPPSALKVLGCVLAFFLAMFLAILFSPDSQQHQNSQQPQNPQQHPNQVSPSVRPGPPLSEVEAVMQRYDIPLPFHYTGAQREAYEKQKEAYWKSVKGTLVTCTGELDDAFTREGGLLFLKCKSTTSTFGVTAYLDGTQLDLIPRLKRGYWVTVQGILDYRGRGFFQSTYTLKNAKIVAIGPRKVTQRVTCAACNGSGYISTAAYETCLLCKGTGKCVDIPFPDEAYETPIIESDYTREFWLRKLSLVSGIPQDELRARWTIVCPTCKGSGSIWCAKYNTCYACNGKGYMEQEYWSW